MTFFLHGKDWFHFDEPGETAMPFGTIVVKYLRENLFRFQPIFFSIIWLFFNHLQNAVNSKQLQFMASNSTTSITPNARSASSGLRVFPKAFGCMKLFLFGTFIVFSHSDLHDWSSTTSTPWICHKLRPESMWRLHLTLKKVWIDRTYHSSHIFTN